MKLRMQITKDKDIRFTGVIGRDEMKDFVLKSLSL